MRGNDFAVRFKHSGVQRRASSAPLRQSRKPRTTSCNVVSNDAGQEGWRRSAREVMSALRLASDEVELFRHASVRSCVAPDEVDERIAEVAHGARQLTHLGAVRFDRDADLERRHEARVKGERFGRDVQGCVAPEQVDCRQIDEFGRSKRAQVPRVAL